MLASKHIETITSTIVGPMSFGDLVRRFKQSGFGLLILFISLPFLQPVPTGGLSTILGSLIVLLGCQLALKRETVWLPAFIEKKMLEEKTGQRLIRTADKFLGMVEKFVRPRLHWIANCESIIGVMVALMALVLMLPIPIPFSNMMCAYPIAFFALSLLEQDGIMAIIGFVLSILSITFHTAVFILGTEAVLMLFKNIFP